MPSLSVFPSALSGSISIPSSKSQTLRALLFASLANGKSFIENPLVSPDRDAMMRALTALGAHFEIHPNGISVTGTGGHLSSPQCEINCGNSGIVLRFIGALAGLIPARTVLTGDHSLQTRRPALPLLSGLTQLGAVATSLNGTGYAPLQIQGRMRAGTARIEGADSQPVSALLIACSLLEGETTLHIDHPGELPWVDLTLSWLDRMQIPYRRSGYTHYTLAGSSRISPFSYQVPGDFSSAAFPLAAALITNSPIQLSGLDFSDPQGDKEIISLLRRQGASLLSEGRSLCIDPTRPLSGGTIDVNPMIDALPILAVLACFAKSPTTLVNCAIARAKESDRLAAISQELCKMGARIEEGPDFLHIFPSPLRGAKLHSHGDHRIAMALAVAALGALSPSTISDTACIRKTYPSFIADFQALGALMQEGHSEGEEHSQSPTENSKPLHHLRSMGLT